MNCSKREFGDLFSSAVTLLLCIVPLPPSSPCPDLVHTQTTRQFLTQLEYLQKTQYFQ